ncbi:hypothetical protein ACH5RR_000250 [Cinchona calisaya]|uniref:HTH myb-type domain-containing protein n=1 Tax=Cinchona calisaya TaxID=153742 RepID=A0ABD3B120_9GENT
MDMGTKGICILVVNDDVTCRNIVSQMLQSCTFEVMSPDDKKIELNGQSIFAAYIINSLSINEIKNLWGIASLNAKKDARKVDHQIQENGSAQIDSTSHNTNEVTTTEEDFTPSNGNQPQKIHQKRKRKKNIQREKKPRIIWTDDLHKKFLEAMEIIFPEKPVPKKIVEVMDTSGLKRAHVASHLQKYRILLKRAEENPSASNHKRSLRKHIGETGFPSWRSSTYFNSLKGNSNVKLEPDGGGMTPFQQDPFGNKSMAAPRNYPFSTRLPISLANLRSPNILAEANNQGKLQKLPDNKDFASLSEQAILSHYNEKKGLSFANSSQGNDHWMERLYGCHQTKNLPISTPPGSLKSDKTFLGLRFTNDGKSLAFGNREIRRENNKFQDPLPIAALLPSQYGPYYQNQISGDNCHWFSSDPISQLVSSLEKTAIHSPSVTVIQQQQQPGNDYSVQYSSTTPMNDNILDDHQPQIPSADEKINVHSSQQENDASVVQQTSTTIQQIPHQESTVVPTVLDELNSCWADGNFFSALMNETANLSSEFHWDDEDFEDSFFDQLH